MKQRFSWVGILLLSVSLWVGFINPVHPQARSLLFLDCRPQGGFLRVNMVPEAAGGIAWQGYGALGDVILQVNGRSSFLLEGEQTLSLPSNPSPAAAISLTLRSLEASARGQTRELGQISLKDMRVYAQEEIGFSGRSTAMLLVDNPVASPPVPFADGIQNCRVSNLSTLRRSLSRPNQVSYGCSCSNPNLPFEMSAEPSSGPVFTDWRDRSREPCRVSLRVEGTFTCSR